MRLLTLIAAFALFSASALATGKPYRDEAFNELYHLLFCDEPARFRASEAARNHQPWSIVLSPSASMEQLQMIARNKELESRARILAYRAMARKGGNTPDRLLLGVVIERALPEGLDVLAAYSDGRARYINHAQKYIAWETNTEESAALVRQLLERGLEASNQIGLWDKKRKPAPEKGSVRITFLLSHGFAFGEGPHDRMVVDELAAPILNAATQLVMFLIGQN